MRLMAKAINNDRGFTLVEIFIVCVVIAILAAIAIVTYDGMQRRAASTVVFKDLKGVVEIIELGRVRPGGSRTPVLSLPESFTPSEKVVMRLVPAYTGDHYSGLTPVQNGVLFYDICEELIADPTYSTIHSKDGNDTRSVVMRCTDNISAGSLLITGWESKTWSTPLAKNTLQSYIDSVPYDNWWIDRQEVVRGFYTELIRRFEAKGGTFPVNSFWDPWANQWSGVPKQDLPSPEPPSESEIESYCIDAYHTDFSDSIYRITQDNKIEAGAC